jgi:phage terminase large subunit-like protein
MRKRIIRTEDEFLDIALEEGISPALGEKYRLSPALQAAVEKQMQGFRAYAPKIAEYNVVKKHLKQIDFHNSHATVKYASGGVGSGKTTCSVMEVAVQLTKLYPNWWQGRRYFRPVRVRMCAPSYESGISNIIIPMLREVLPQTFAPRDCWKRNTSGQINRIELPSGDFVQFMSYKQDEQDFASDMFDIVTMDEPPSRAIYEENLSRTFRRDPIGYVMITATVLLKHSWLYETMDADRMGKDYLFHTNFETQDNPSITPAQIEALTRGLSEEARNARLRGVPQIMQGLVFKFRRDTHLRPRFAVKYPEFTEYMAIDPHPRQSWHCAWYAVNHRDEHFVTGEEYQNLNTIKQVALRIALREGRITEEEWGQMQSWDELAIQRTLCGRFHSQHGGRMIWARIIDTSAATPNSQTGDPDIIALGRYGIHCIPARKDFDSGKERIESWLDPNPAPLLYVFSDCHEHIYQFEHYFWDEFGTTQAYEAKDPKQMPRKKRDHFMDLLRYFANFNPQCRVLRNGPPQLYRRRAVNSFAGV